MSVKIVLVCDHPDHASRSGARGVATALNSEAYRLDWAGVFEALRARAGYCILAVVPMEHNTHHFLNGTGSGGEFPIHSLHLRLGAPRIQPNIDM